MASLQALRSTGLVRAPRPMKIFDIPGGGAAFVMEHLKMRTLSRWEAQNGQTDTGAGRGSASELGDRTLFSSQAGQSSWCLSWARPTGNRLFSLLPVSWCPLV